MGVRIGVQLHGVHMHGPAGCCGFLWVGDTVSVLKVGKQGSRGGRGVGLWREELADRGAKVRNQLQQQR
jgi:hypothetical protein